jgi:membrane-associated phospholipid phosphatase
MRFSLSAGRASHRSRISPVSCTGICLTLLLMALGIAASVATKFTFASLPNILLPVIGIAILDVAIQYAPPGRIVEGVQTFLYGFLYLGVTIVCGIFAAYAMQRLAFPLQDGFLDSSDKALGFQWVDYAFWVDNHPLVQQVFYHAYHSIMLQTLLPLVVLVLANRIDDLRLYLLAYAIAFVSTIIVSALMPAAGPIAFVDRSMFHILHFTGGTPLDHLARLREAGSLVFDDPPGGIATFPSFHATIAILTPLSLRRIRPIFIALLFLDAAMLGATVTEGAHYLTDIIAGSGMALFGYAMAKRILLFEDRYRFASRNVGFAMGSAA